jgi:hypothetical protein
VPERSPGKNRRNTAPAVGGLFFPQSKSLGVDRSQFSPALQSKITFAGANNTSYAQAEQDLRVLADLAISDKQVRRVCQAIGAERVAERDTAVANYQALPLTQRKDVPTGVQAPAVAVVSVDGGRLQIFERVAKADKEKSAAAALAALALGAAATLPEPALATAEPAPTTEEIQDDMAVPEPTRTAKKPLYWREDKIGLFLTMQSDLWLVDPCPHIPETFVNPHWIAELAKEMSRQAPVRDLTTQTTGPPEIDPAADTDTDAWKPKVQTKELVATRRPWEKFGPLLATQAWLLGYYGASRRGFVADGAETNWTLWREHFSSFEPILDFIHALTYVFHAALAGRSAAEGWATYRRWIGWVWSGKVAQTIAELAQRQAELGVPAKDAPASSPAAIVSRALGYLQNHKERMRYDEYRRAGLPIVSSYAESAVKQFNYRVKGTEKLWREAGAEQMLQLRADYLSEGNRMARFWQRRQASESGQARHRKAA